MRAFALTAPDQPAGIVDIAEPTVGPGGLSVRVRAASVNGIDV